MLYFSIYIAITNGFTFQVDLYLFVHFFPHCNAGQNQAPTHQVYLVEVENTPKICSNIIMQSVKWIFDQTLKSTLRDSWYKEHNFEGWNQLLTSDGACQRGRKLSSLLQTEVSKFLQSHYLFNLYAYIKFWKEHLKM